MKKSGIKSNCENNGLLLIKNFLNDKVLYSKSIRRCMGLKHCAFISKKNCRSPDKIIILLELYIYIFS